MWLYLLIIIQLLIFFLLQRNVRYWTKQNIPCTSLRHLLISCIQMLFRRQSFGDVFTEVYRKHKEYPFVGVFSVFSPVLLVRDPDLIKHIVSTDFKSFYDNGFSLDLKVDPILGKNPFFLKGEAWKKTRAQLTPGFTSGKMKFVFPLVQSVAENFVSYLEKNPKKICAKEVCSKFTCDTVASAAFGIEAKNFEIDNSEFMRIANGFIGTEGNSGLVSTLATIFPSLFSIFNMKVSSQYSDDRLIEIVSTTMEYRKQNNVTRNDFLQFLMHIKETTPDFSKVDAAASAAAFFADGYETSSVVLSILLYELAANPVIQQTLRNEIEEHLEKSNGVVTYENMQQFKYLEACVYESLRKNTVLPIHSKLCTQKFEYTTESDNFKKINVQIDPGTLIYLPICGLHTDKKYFDDPFEYRPERMLNREDISKYVLMPFGVGQRTCLGQRFGLMQVELATIYLIRNFKIQVNKETILPVRSDPWHFMAFTKNPIYLDFAKIH